jgi:hypothetical protein
MQTAIGEIVLIDTRHLQDRVVDRGVLCARQVLNGALRHRVGRRADLRLDADPRFVERLGDHVYVERQPARGCRRRRVRGRAGRRCGGRRCLIGRRLGEVQRQPGFEYRHAYGFGGCGGAEQGGRHRQQKCAGADAVRHRISRIENAPRSHRGIREGGAESRPHACGGLRLRTRRRMVRRVAPTAAAPPQSPAGRAKRSARAE